ncbi:Alcohol dehydrogenase, class IV [Halalkaliarchaeum sp. AArc-CO]|uniref:iron-containing alcohol dehydrogenase n=1 Tax=unclassified Halalkaliarchaeum TaxID=2678344 RepID=UPI00217EF4AF|nr:MULTISPECIES: iron-containing alcohol dehydrogenase [unclassified Halalkaliarchaeum]MDR5672193.1 iron-containing alcohol dehydrogenase [Halalkaliarchaeum sp. AArc-GB]UWG51699.1 Alcohol dehydrogenase, class IV [Halalkaliarchaeum sp. AArc-CO]
MSFGEYTLSFPIWVEFGNGKSERVGPLVDSQQWESVLVVTDEGIREVGLLEGIEQSLDDAGIEYIVYDGVEPNPTTSMVEEATGLLDTEGCDAVVAVGGGSVMDVGKGATLMATNSGEVADYEVKSAEDVMEAPIETEPLPLVTVPTTAGTGSEVDYWAVITDEERDFKMAMGQPPLYPDGPYLGAEIALVDPELTASLPPRQTAATGFDAFSHALENHVSSARPPVVEPLTYNVMELVSANLVEAYEEGTMASRERMMFASNVAGICENFAGFGAIHSLAEVTGGMYPEIPHGEAIAAFTPAVMRYNLEEVPDRYAEVAQAMGVDVSGLSEEEAAREAVAAVEELIAAVDLPESLADLDVDEGDLPEIAENALYTIEIHDNPRDADAEDLLEIARDAY